MATIQRKELATAAEVSLGELSSDPNVMIQLQQLHDLVLSVCPTCMIEQRNPNDDALIYVPEERQHATRYKNLLTMWADASSVRLRIMPDEEEVYDSIKMNEYRRRMKRLLGELLARNS